MSLAAHACPPRQRSQQEQAIRALARTNPTVAECVGLVDNNGLPWAAGLEAAVLELARLNQQLVDENMALRLSRSLPDRDDDGACLGCGEVVDCRCRPGGAA